MPLPSTIQSYITFTSLAHGNVAAADCSAAASNVLGVFLTPLLMSFLMNTQGSIPLSATGSVAMQLLVPFVIGHLARQWIGHGSSAIALSSVPLIAALFCSRCISPSAMRS